jgi:APA family basic amino acid/polyamine antiporter
MIITGPRVTQVMGEDYKMLRWFSKITGREIPVRAIIILGIISILYILTSTFEQVITLIGFTLNLFTLLTVTGLIINRRRNPGQSAPFKMKLYPVLPIIFIFINLWILVYGLIYRPAESFAGILIAAAGGLFYLIEKKNKS